MSADEVTFLRKDYTKKKIKYNSMFATRPGDNLDEENGSTSDMICMHMLTPTSHADRRNQQPRAKSYGPFDKTQSQSSVNKMESTDDNSKINKLNTEQSDDSHVPRAERHLARLNTQLLEAVEHCDAEKANKLIIDGANPNATCRLKHDSACHIAALVGGGSLSILLKHGAQKDRSAKSGRTPMHVAAWAGNATQIALLLELPDEIQHKIQNDFISNETEEKIRGLKYINKWRANVKSEIRTTTGLSITWKDCIEHKCMDLKLPFIEPTWAPLHVASSRVQHHCVRLLLAAGADPNNQDIMGKTPLDVAGSAFYQGQEISKEKKVIKILLDAGSKFYADHTLKKFNSPLHTAIELEYLDIVETILDAGATIQKFNNKGETPLHICVRKKLKGLEIFSKYSNDMLAYDIQDINGYTTLHAAVKSEWITGTYTALEGGANIILKAKNGETPIHTAAQLGNISILNEILSIAKRNQTVDNQNNKGETALFKAIIHGHLDCVELILKEGASINKKLPGNFNVLHIATKFGHSDILKVLLNHNDVIKNDLINDHTTLDHEGLGPIHLAAMYNHAECVKLLLNNNADVRLKVLKDYMPYNASTPLDIAAIKNNLEIAKIILDRDKKTLHELVSYNWSPLHAASYYGSRDVIFLFLSEGADMTLRTKGPNKFKETSADLIMKNLYKPTQFMEEVFDSYIYTNDVLNLVTVDYQILTSNAGPAEQMKVVEALLKTGNRFGQRKLLVHPLVESFLYLNWMSLLPFFYIMIGIYGMYVLSLNIYITSTFFHKDTKNVPSIWFDPSVWIIFVYITGALIIVQEIVYILNVGIKRYFDKLESWIRLAALSLAMILPPVFLSRPEDVWPRHVATVAVLLSWTEMMFMLSRFPNWGYYVLMLGKVLSKVLKILLTFVFLVIGFAVSFMVQFHSQSPFDGPWSAFVKTMVMMTSEFDYLDLFDDKHTKGLSQTSLNAVRIIFLIFLILVGIVLINLMVGVAVNDLHNLEVHGNVKRLEKQVEFLASLEAIVYNKFLARHLPKWTKRKIMSQMTISAVDYKSLPTHLRDALFNNAQVRLNKRDDEMNTEILKNKLDEILKTCLENNRRRVSNEMFSKHGIKTETLDTTTRNKSIKTVVDNNELVYKEQVAELKERMGLISMEMDAINVLLHKLE